MYKLVFFVPESHCQAVKQSLFALGVGQQGEYQQCCWQTLGQGQFMPSAQANPHLGEAGKLEQVNEYRVEMLCPEHLLVKAVAALRQAHPYEEPAYEVYQILDL